MTLTLLDKIIISDESGFACSKTKLVEDGLLHIRPFNIGNSNQIDLSQKYQVPFEEAPNGKTALIEGDILFNNTNSVELVGKSALVTCEMQAGFSNHITRIRLDRAAVEPAYFAYWLALKRSQGYFSANATQWVSQAAFKTSELRRLSVELPPLPEQRRIVDLLSRAEGIVRLRREAEKKAAELIPALFNDMFGDPATNPKGWPVETLGQHVMIPSAVRTPDLVADADMPCVGADSIESMTGKLISMPTVRDVLPKSGKYSFEAGDVLYSKIRPYLAKVTLAQCKGYCSADMYPLRCNATLRSTYLLTMLLGRVFTDYATSESVRASMPKLNRESLFKYEFPLPPVGLQDLFAVNADAMLSIQSQQATATAKAQATFDALLADAFKAA